MDKIVDFPFQPLDIAKFWMNVRIADETRVKWKGKKNMGKCWLWTGSFFDSGYGRFFSGYQAFRAHRLSYFLFNGRLPENLLICHLCDNPACVSPKHLFLGTCKDNMKDRDVKGRYKRRSKTKCKSTTSFYHGVFFRNDSKKWRVVFSIDGKSKRFGTYPTEIEAALKYDEVVKQLKLDLPLNFPDQAPQKALKAL